MKNRGKLKIYFGYCNGVGKTYTMLKDAHQMKRMGIDVVVGCIGHCNNEEVRELAEGLEAIPQKMGVEFDLQGALKRKPRVILLDELAHVNMRGSKHEYRYMDIDELLVSGIDVNTTLNVMDIESLADTVEELLGIKVEERISDFIFDCAERVELIDIEPIELIKRYNEGKICGLGNAADQVFNNKNLDMLRTLAINRTKERLNLICYWT